MTSLWTGRRVRLRAIEPGDWSAFMAFDQSTTDTRRADQVWPPRSAAAYQRWAGDKAGQVPTGDAFMVGIEALKSRELVGSVSTHAVDPRKGSFYYGVSVAAQHRRKGYASEAVRLLLAFMFGERRYHKCEASVFAFNEPSIALHLSMGFVQEGRLREHEFFAGRRHDVLLFGITAPEFAARHPFGEV
ncbi:GNAT family N-acetyltransferase [Allonocardiopsis opalescens]|uniref:RimJ/RimL family protein N-acetyltransferase n=1 Tax=Allonocardiopsis opalescens TaxID=1144618 RepID=A0A2T0Q4S2_9ACTN|nr:GNAT family protein [Allonocardiopsis opalescens]PRX98818.1 RimJ/RimL family protein N-acetyltransferase [Allonocardiopsis opalescens]